MLRDWLRGAFRSGLATAALVLFVASPLFGQASTGKIQGRVTDATTGAPIAGAQVVVDNTTLGNLTNDQGFYFINEVPAGLQNVRSQFIGYRAFVVEGQRILAGQTTTMNFELEQTAVELEAITVEGERNPLVPRDQTSTKSIVRGDVIDQLPLDNAMSVVVLLPGVVQTNQGTTIRGGRVNEEAVFVDGVLVRSFGQGRSGNLQVPTNALEQVDVNVGAFSAEFGEGQSGVISFVTRSGGPKFTGALEFQTDQVTNSWRRNFNRAELSLGGPIAGPVTFFLAGTVQGLTSNRTQDYPTRWVVDGIETCPTGGSGGADYSTLCEGGQPAIFSEPRSSNAAGALDFVNVGAANFVPWDNGRTFPNNWSQTGLFTANVNWQLPRGSRINFSYNRNRFQNFGQSAGFQGMFNPDNVDGGLTTNNVFTLGWFQTLMQSADQQLAMDLRASYQTDRTSTGMLDPGWWLDNQDPFLGFAFGNVGFLLPDDQTVTGFSAFDVTDDYLNAYRSNAIPRDSMIAFPQRNDLGVAQSIPGLDRNLRANPFGTRIDYDISNPGNGGLRKVDEDRLQLRGTLDWQIGRFNRVKLGGEYIKIDMQANNVPLYIGVPLPEAAEPTRIGAFLQDRLDIGDLVIEGGIRYDYLDPDTELPITPGFVFNVPDSLQAGFLAFSSDGTYVDKYDTPCNGAPVCKSNFVPTQTKSEWSPRIGASFPVTPTSTFRLSYGRFVQTPAFFTTSSFATGIANTAPQTVGFLQDSNTDLTSTNTNATFARDVNMPSTRTFEFGYRQLIGQDLVIDVSAFNKKQRSALTTRKLPFVDPVAGQTVFMNVVTNKDFTETNGFEMKLDKAITNLFIGSLTYTFVDARGTSSDPFTYENLVQRAVSNFAVLTGLPPNPPEVMLTLDQSRRHNIGFTSSLAFPVDYRQGSTMGAILSDFGFFAVLRVRSGLPVTLLQNSGNGQTGPPSNAGLDAQLQTSINNTTTPWTTGIDFRFTKGFQLGRGWNLQAFVDWRNPFNLTQQTRVFLETGNEFNDQFRTKFLSDRLTDTQLDGDNVIRDFDIIAESPENAFNKYMLLRAEERYGDGNGIFTVEEQETAFLQLHETIRGSDVAFKTSDQQLRLGLRVAF